ncbi:MAG: hypothetical protein R3E95_24595, partial [Thiolinea sp.]
EELATDEQIPEENKTSFVEDCVAENMPIEGAADDDMMMEDEDAAPMDENAPAEEELPPEDPAQNEDGAPKTE